MATYPRETKEFVPVLVRVNGIPVTDNVEFALCTSSQRPTGWVAAALLGGETGVMLNHQAVGVWHVWARITDNPEIPIVHCGVLQVN